MAALQLNQLGPHLHLHREPIMTYTAFEIITADEARYVPARARYYEATGFSVHTNPRTGRDVVRYENVNPRATESVEGPRTFRNPEPAPYEFLGAGEDGLATYRVPWSL
jgi:hypothetical protein